MLAWISRSETSLLKLKIVYLSGLLYLQQIIGGSEFWKYVGIDCDTDLSWNILGKSIKSIPLLMNGILMKCRI